MAKSLKPNQGGEAAFSKRFFLFVCFLVILFYSVVLKMSSNKQIYLFVFFSQFWLHCESESELNRFSINCGLRI